MKPLTLLFLLSSFLLSLAYPWTLCQSDEYTMRKGILLSDVKRLALEIPKLDGPLARALAGAEIADAAWTLDRSWAKSLLKEAYQLTCLSEDEQSKIGPEPPGTPPRPPTAISRARNEVRRRILSVARKDRVFVDQLMSDRSARLTKDDRQMMYAQAAVMALDEGDTASAIHSIEENMAIDPAQLMLVQLVNNLALKNRAEADRLILQYIATLATTELADGKLGRARAEGVLRWIVFPNSFFPDPEKRVPNPGPAVMKAYVNYVIESLAAQEQREPGSLRLQRTTLLTAWLPLNQYAPELKERFMQLEGLSRTPGKDASLPTKTNEELDDELFRKRQSEALNSPEPNQLSIDSMIAHEDFESARKLISKVSDAERKRQLSEQVDMKEALVFAKKGDLVAAQNLAERLTATGSVLQVYLLIVEGYVRNRDQTGAVTTVQQAIRKLKDARDKPAPTNKQFGMPAEFAPAITQGDGTLSALGKLAKAVLPIDPLLAAGIVDEMVVTANSSQIETTQGHTGISSDLFKSLAARDEVRARSAAESFKDRLRRVVALAAIYQWKATELEKSNKDAQKAQMVQ